MSNSFKEKTAQLGEALCKYVQPEEENIILKLFLLDVLKTTLLKLKSEAEFILMYL